MILEVLANRKVGDGGDAEVLGQLFRCNSRDLEELRGLDGPTSNDDFSCYGC